MDNPPEDFYEDNEDNELLLFSNLKKDYYEYKSSGNLPIYRYSINKYIVILYTELDSTIDLFFHFKFFYVTNVELNYYLKIYFDNDIERIKKASIPFTDLNTIINRFKILKKHALLKKIGEECDDKKIYNLVRIFFSDGFLILWKELHCNVKVTTFNKHKIYNCFDNVVKNLEEIHLKKISL